MRAFHGRATAKKGGGLNGLEQRYADHLEQQRQDGFIAMWMAHPFSLRLAKGTHYEPDFLVVRNADMTVEIHEVKGFMHRVGQAKLKIAAERFPFRFLLVKRRLVRDGGGWELTEVGT